MLTRSRLSRRRAVAVLVVLLVLAAGAILLVCLGSGSSGAEKNASSAATPVDAKPVTPLPARTTDVAPPTPGTIEDTLAPGQPGPTVAAALDEPVVLAGIVDVTVLAVTPTQVEAVGPGDPSGPALAVRVRLDNTSDRQVDVDGAQVSLLYKQGKQIGIPTPGGAQPFVGQLGAKKSVEGTYVFAVPDTSQKSVTILVTYAAGAPVAKFDGAAR